ncbi:MAG TPA: hypothetical protein VJI13_02780 [Candidatus Norongarragalinales archaeon]|nr:hypothetical protein [Candidatus Norongarragalinales archaeon]
MEKGSKTSKEVEIPHGGQMQIGDLKIAVKEIRIKRLLSGGEEAQVDLTIIGENEETNISLSAGDGKGQATNFACGRYAYTLLSADHASARIQILPIEYGIDFCLPERGIVAFGDGLQILSEEVAHLDPENTYFVTLAVTSRGEEKKLEFELAARETAKKGALGRIIWIIGVEPRLILRVKKA